MVKADGFKFVLFAVADDGAGQRVGGKRSSEKASCAISRSRPGGKLSTVSTRSSPVVSVPGFIQSHDGCVRQFLDRRAAAEEDPMLRAPSDSRKDR